MVTKSTQVHNHQIWNCSKSANPKSKWVENWASLAGHGKFLGGLLKRLMMDKATNRKASGLPGEEEELYEMAARQAF